MSERRPYSRIYWSVLDDPKFETIYGDDAAFALWVRLLLTADALWPSPAPLPRGTKPKALVRLVEAGIVDTLSGDRYRIHGLDNEREIRKQLATTRGPDGHRTVTGREASGDLAKPSQAETKPSQGQAEARDPADIYFRLVGRFPSSKALPWIDRLAEQYGSEPTCSAMAAAFMDDRDTQTLLGRTEDRLAADARKLDLKERAEEKQRLVEKRAQPRVEEAWRAEFRAAIEEQYRRSAA
jgi:hypothetical protein